MANSLIFFCNFMAAAPTAKIKIRIPCFLERGNLDINWQNNSAVEILTEIRQFCQ